MQVQEGAQAQYDAFYRLSNTEQQITSYVFDVSLSCSPLLLHAFDLSRCKRQSEAGLSCSLFTKDRQACSSAHVLSPLLQVVRAIVPKIILDDVFTVRPQLMHSCMVNVGLFLDVQQVDCPVSLT